MKYTLMTLALLALPFSSWAQLPGPNLIKNPGIERFGPNPSPPDRPEEGPFEDEDEEDEVRSEWNDYRQHLLEVRPLDWYIRKGNNLSYNRVQDNPHGGSYAMRVYPTGEAIYPHPLFNYIEVTPGDTYEFSYWYRGNFDPTVIQLTATWYATDGGGRAEGKDTPSEALQKVDTPEEQVWKEKKIRLTAPLTAHFVSLGINFKYSSRGGAIYLDDVAFRKVAERVKTEVPKPTNLKAETYQREIRLHWNEVPDASYEVYNGERLISKVSTNEYFLTGLVPNTAYNLKVRTVKGDATSEFVGLTGIRTERMEYGVEDPERIPYLYQIGQTGKCPRRLGLFFNDLGTTDAQIRCWIDNQPITPEGSYIVFPSTGKHLLRVEVVETESRRWTIEYKLNVD